MPRPFDFQLRTRVVFGDGALARLGELARELSFTRTLVVADPRHRGDRTRGSAPQRRSRLPGSLAFFFHDFDANPDTRMVDAGRARRGGRVPSTRSWRSAAAARSTARRGSTSCSPTAARCATTAASARRRGRCCRRSACRRRRAPAARRSRTRSSPTPRRTRRWRAAIRRRRSGSRFSIPR